MFFVPGHPGYQVYLSAVLYATAALAVGVAAFFLVALRRGPKDLGRRALAAGASCEAIAAILYLPALDQFVVARLGSPNIVELAATVCGGGYSTAL